MARSTATSTVHDCHGDWATAARPPGAPAGAAPPGLAAGARDRGCDVTPGPAVAARRSRSGSGRLPGRRGYTERPGSRRRPRRRGGRPLGVLAGRARTGRVAAGLVAMSQRQVLQGRARGAPTGLAAGTAGTAAAPCLSPPPPQCSSSTRKPGPSSCRWWRSWRPDPKTSRPCRTRVSPRPDRASLRAPGLAPAPRGPGPRGAPWPLSPHPGSRAPGRPVSPAACLNPGLPRRPAPLPAELWERSRVGTGGRRP